MAGWLSQIFEKRKVTAGSPPQSASASAPVDASPMAEDIRIATRKEAEQEAGQIIDHAKQGADEIRRRVTVSLRSLIDRAVSDAEQVASSIKTQSRKEAEEEALKIINEAKQKAEEIKKQIDTVSLKEAEEILVALDSTAPAAGEEVKQKLQLYLLKARQEIEKEVRENYEQAQSRVTNFLETQEKLAPPAVKMPSQIQQETNTVAVTEADTEPATKAGIMKSRFTFSLKSTAKTDKSEPVTKAKAKKSRFSFSLRGVAKADEFKIAASPDIREKAEETKLEKPAKRKTDKDAKLAVKAETKRKAEEAKQSREAGKRTGKEANLLTRLTRMKKAGGATSVIQEELRAVSEEPKQADDHRDIAEPKVKTVTAEMISEKKSEEPIPVKQVTPAEKPAEEKVREPRIQRPPDKESTRPIPVISTEKLDTNALFEGEIELAIAVPVDPAAVTKLFNYVQGTPDMKVLYTRGSWDKGTLITVALDKPMPFLGMISGISGLSISAGVAPKVNNIRGSSNALLGTKRQEAVRLDLVLRTQ